MAFVATNRVAISVVTDYGADPTGVADSTTAFQNALTQQPTNSAGTAPLTGVAISVYVPAGNYKITGTLNIQYNGTSLFGDGTEATVITMYASATSTNQTTPALTVSSGLNFVTISNLSLRRNVTSLTTLAQAGGDGIVVMGNPEITNCRIENVLVDSHWIGFSLGSTSYSIVQNCYAQNCQSHGFYLTNTDINSPPIQWSLINTISQLNAGNGYMAEATLPTGATKANLTAIMNPWIYPTSYGNLGYGVCVQGHNVPAAPPSPAYTLSVSDFEVVGGFLAQDGNTEIYINSYSFNIRILSTLADLAGTLGGIGPDITKNLHPNPSNTGYGLDSENNLDITIVGSTFVQNSFSGIRLAGDAGTIYLTEALITGCRVVDNNAINSNLYNGIDIGEQQVSGSQTSQIIASCTISGCRIGNQNPPGHQQYGVYCTFSNNNVLITACNLHNNAMGTYSSGGTILAATNLG